MEDAVLVELLFVDRADALDAREVVRPVAARRGKAIGNAGRLLGGRRRRCAGCRGPGDGPCGRRFRGCRPGGGSLAGRPPGGGCRLFRGRGRASGGLCPFGGRSLRLDRFPRAGFHLPGLGCARGDGHPFLVAVRDGLAQRPRQHGSAVLRAVLAIRSGVELFDDGFVAHLHQNLLDLLVVDAEIGGDDARVGPHRLRVAVGDLAAIFQHHDVIGNLHHHRHVVLDQQDRGAGIVLDVHQQLVERQRFLRIEAGGRLVQAQEFGPGAHRTRDLQPALRSVGQVAGGIVGPIEEIGLFQPVLGKLDGFCRRLAVAADAEQAEERIARGFHQLVVLGHEQVLQHRHAGKQADVLEGAGNLGFGGDLEIGQALEQELLSVAAGEADHAFGRLVETGDAVEHRGLAGAVGPDQRGDLAAPGLEGQVADGDQPAELHRQMLDLEKRVVHGWARVHQPCPSLVKEPETAFRSFRKAVGSRLPTKPRGFQTMTMTIATPNSSMR